MNQLFYFFI